MHVVVGSDIGAIGYAIIIGDAEATRGSERTSRYGVQFKKIRRGNRQGQGQGTGEGATRSEEVDNNT